MWRGISPRYISGADHVHTSAIDSKKGEPRRDRSEDSKMTLSKTYTAGKNMCREE
jgi:hypothetical protein